MCIFHCQEGGAAVRRYTGKKRDPRRWAALDNLRGLTLLSMIAYHACWDMVWIFGADWSWYRSAAAYAWQQSICWTFILLSGFCWPMGSRPLRRGLEVFGGGVLVTAATLLFMPPNRIVFGVLTLLGTCMLVMIPLERGLRHVPSWAGLAGSGLLFVLLRNVNGGFLGFEGLRFLALPSWLYRNLATAFLGFPPGDFYSTDYFPMLPWFFLFLTGYFFNRLWRDHRRIRAGGNRIPLLSALGRCSLPVYLLHQPVVYGILWTVLWLKGV